MTEQIVQGEPTHHDLPVTSSEERMHDLSEDCWCKPTVEHVPAGVPKVTHSPRACACGHAHPADTNHESLSCETCGCWEWTDDPAKVDRTNYAEMPGSGAFV